MNCFEGVSCFNKYSQSHMNNNINNRDFSFQTVDLVNIILSDIILFFGMKYFDNVIR